MNSKEFFYIVISSFILTVIWIASNVYHAYATSTIDTLLQMQIEPIMPDFDMQTINKIKQRVKIEPETRVALPTQEPTPTTSVLPTPSDETPDIEETILISPIEQATETPTITP
jgi:hypothetical protein